MEKLELKHLAPYLPYGLEFIYTHTNERGCLRSLYNIEEYEDIKLSINWMDGEHIWMFKPILRPLSDLTKEIEHNGEMFAPIEWFEIGDDNNETYEYDNGNIRLIEDLEYLSINRLSLDIVFIPYGVIQKLIEWHFDVFGLIDKGLAIDINTLNK